MPDNEPIQAVVTALDIIEFMAQANGPIGVSDLARGIGRTKPRIYRHLRTLVDQGYVTQDPATERYQLTLSLFHIGQAIAEQVSFLAEARREMPALHEQVAQTVTIGQVESGGVRVLDILRHRSEIEIASRPGSIFDFHSSAQGKVSLAFGSDALWDFVESAELRKWTSKTNVDLNCLREEVAQVRRQGWAVAPEEALIGINALSAPIFDGTGDLAGTINIVGSVQHLEPDPAAYFIEAVMGAAARISTRLGYRG
ncbi:MAG: IclR family transcriptional regulator [Alphaproteobacteria bacterium]